MSDFLLEIGCEEIPARFLPQLQLAIQFKIDEMLTAKRLRQPNDLHNDAHNAAQVMANPRRIAVRVKNLLEVQEDFTVELKGPPVAIAKSADGTPLSPGLGFAQKAGVPFNQLVEKEDSGRKILVANIHHKGQAVAHVLAEELPALIQSIHLPIAMKWGCQKEAFIRPIHWILALLGSEIVTFELFGISSGRDTRGHRFLSTTGTTFEGAVVAVANASESTYEDALLGANVRLASLSHTKDIYSKEIIEKFVKERTDDVDFDLLTEVAYLTEWPTSLIGNIDPKYLQIPQEFLIACMKNHQKYFPVIQNGTLEPRFIVIADSVTPANQATIIAGNERVLTARLEDVKFFWEEDQKQSLVDRVQALDKVVFQKNAGSMLEKVERIQKLTDYLISELGFQAHAETIRTTARLAKADLTTHLVYELPELQGIAGRHLAEFQKLPSDVALGIEEHYMPQSATAELPKSPAGIVVGLADKIDTIVVSIANGITPTGSQDPWGIRRLMTGVGLVAMGLGTHLNIRQLIDKAFEVSGMDQNSRPKLEALFVQRITSHWSDMTVDTINAVENRVLDDIDLAHQIARQIKEFRGSEATDSGAFKTLLEAAVRVIRIAKDTHNVPVEPAQFEDKAESDLWNHAKQIEDRVTQAVAARDASKLIEDLASLVPSISAYFEHVLVNTDNHCIRTNRLATLANVAAVLGHVCDFTQLNHR